jgi:uncharacterized protein YcfJ
MQKNTLLIGSLVALVVIATGAAAYFAGSSHPSQQPVKQAHATTGTRQVVQQTPTASQTVRNCDDHNIVGTGLGAVAGGVLGSQFGKGSGKTAATVGGVVAGGVAGNQLIPTNGVTCR